MTRAGLFRWEAWRELPVHPAAAAFPLLTDTELEEKLVQDMRVNGFSLKHPVTLKEGVLLDGRNRLRACEAAGVEPWFEEYEEETVLAFIVRENLARRHLTTAQQAGVMARLAEPFLAEGRERQRRAGGDQKSEAAREKALRANLHEAVEEETPAAERRTNHQLASISGVSARTIDGARAVLKADPVLFEKILAGEMKVGKAERMVRDAAAKQGASRRRGEKSPQKLPARLDNELLTVLEARIEGKTDAFLEVATALFEIRERALFLDTHGQFSNYVRDRWGISWSRGRQMECGLNSLLYAKVKTGKGF